MKFNVKQAYKKINAKEIKKVEKKGYYLNAVISLLQPDESLPHNFIFTFLNQKDNLIIQIIVDSDSVEIKKPSKATKPTTEKLNFGKIKVFHKSVLKKAFKEFKKINEPLSQTILALEKKEWKVTFITKLLNVFIVHIDATNGNIKKTHKVSLVSSK